MRSDLAIKQLKNRTVVVAVDVLSDHSRALVLAFTLPQTNARTVLVFNLQHGIDDCLRALPS